MTSQPSPRKTSLDMKWDVRTIDRAQTSGKVLEKDYAELLETLPDLQEKGMSLLEALPPKATTSQEEGEE